MIRTAWAQDQVCLDAGLGPSRPRNWAAWLSFWAAWAQDYGCLCPGLGLPGRRTLKSGTCAGPYQPNVQSRSPGLAGHSPKPCAWLQGHDEIVWAVVVSEGRLFSASADKTIRVWDIATRRCEQASASSQLGNANEGLVSTAERCPMPWVWGAYPGDTFRRRPCSLSDGSMLDLVPKWTRPCF